MLLELFLRHLFLYLSHLRGLDSSVRAKRMATTYRDFMARSNLWDACTFEAVNWTGTYTSCEISPEGDQIFISIWTIRLRPEFKKFRKNMFKILVVQMSLNFRRKPVHLLVSFFRELQVSFQMPTAGVCSCSSRRRMNTGTTRVFPLQLQTLRLILRRYSTWPQ